MAEAMNDTEPRELTAVYERDRDGYWLVELADEPRVHSYGRTLTKARTHILDAAALWYEVDPDRLVVVDDVRIPPSVLTAVDAARAARGRAQRSAREADTATRAAAAALVDEAGLSVRDAAELLGVSHQRVHQLLERPERPRGRQAATA